MCASNIILLLHTNVRVRQNALRQANVNDRHIVNTNPDIRLEFICQTFTGQSDSEYNVRDPITIFTVIIYYYYCYNCY